MTTQLLSRATCWENAAAAHPPCWPLARAGQGRRHRRFSCGGYGTMLLSVAGNTQRMVREYVVKAYFEW